MPTVLYTPQFTVMKSLVILGCMAALAIAQRPFYAGTSQKIYPELASRFKDTEDSSSDSSSTTSTNVVNRIGEESPQTTVKIPVDARGDVDLVNWLNTWPRENRPFWLLNAEYIEKFRDPEGTRRKQQEQEILSRSSFDDYQPQGPSYEVQRPSYAGRIGRR